MNGPPLDIHDASILIVDDEPVLSAVLESVLRRAGFHAVRCVDDPTDVVRIVEEDEPDLIVLDLHMPQLDGFGVLDALRRLLHPDEYLPVLVVTADPTEQTKRRALSAGARDYLAKPYDATEAVLRIGNLLETRLLHRRARQELHGHRFADRERDVALRARILELVEGPPIPIAYQPIVELAGRRIVGLEALARIAPPPAQPPDRWFADAARLGLGAPLELAAVSAALRVLPGMPDGSFLAVNLSPGVVLADELAPLLSASGGADRVVLELTEHARVDDYDVLTAAIAGLRSIGVRIAVDDAGAGYASLTHILRLQPEIIKLDVTLTRGISTDPVRRALGAALVTFARETDALLTAEGVETAEELEALVELGFDAAQGWYLGRPIAPSATAPPAW